MRLNKIAHIPRFGSYISPQIVNGTARAITEITSADGTQGVSAHVSLVDNVHNSSGGVVAECSVIVDFGGVSGSRVAECLLRLSSAQVLWSVNAPYLYNARVAVFVGGVVVDEVGV